MHRRVAAELQGRPLLAAGLAFAALAAVARIASFQKPIERDTGQDLYVGQLVLHGATPYVDAALNKGPLTFALFAAIDAVSGTSVVLVRLCLLIFVVLAALAVAEYVRIWAGRAAGIAAGATFALLSAAEPLQGDDPNTEQFGVAFMAGAWALSARPSRRAAAAAGLVGAAGFAINPLFGIVAPFMALELWRSAPDDRTGRFAAGALGAAVVLAVVLAWMLAGGALGDLRHFLLQDRLFSRGGGSGLSTGHAGLHDVLDVPGGALYLLGVCAALLALRRRYLRAPAAAALGWIVLVWLKTEAQAYSFPHHYYVALPGIAVAIGLGIASIWPEDVRGRALTVAIVLVFPFVAYVAGPQFRELAVPPSDRWAVDAQLPEPWGLSYPVAQFIHDHTRTHDRIYMAGANPEVYWLSERRASSRFFDYYYPLRSPRFAAERIHDLERRPPVAIGAMPNGDAQADLPTLARFMVTHGYRLSLELSGAKVWLLPARSSAA